MSPARRLLYKRPGRCVSASKTRGVREKNLAFDVNDFPCPMRKIGLAISLRRREYPSKRLITMQLLRFPMFVVKLAVW
jgi:hypothetical protein